MDDWKLDSNVYIGYKCRNNIPIYYYLPTTDLGIFNWKDFFRSNTISGNILFWFDHLPTMHSHSASFMTTRKFEILLFSPFLSISSILTDVLGNQPIQKIFLFPSAFSRKDFWLSLAQIFGWYKRDETSHETRSKHWFALWPVKSASLAKVLATKLVCCPSKFCKSFDFPLNFLKLEKEFTNDFISQMISSNSYSTSDEDNFTPWWQYV